MMVINNNLPALGAYDVVNNTSNQLQKSIQKLSTGLRINSAADDAAGLSISEKMRAQINGLDRAVANTQDGISLIQTAEGALTETHSILQRMRELSVQAANDTFTAQDRSYIQEEIDLLRDEIDHIGNTTTFNTKKLLNGDSAALWSSDNLNTKAIIRGGLRTIDQFGQKTSAEGNYKITITSTPGMGEVQKTNQLRIKHAIAEMEWDDETAVTDGNIVDGAAATGMSRLMNKGDTLSVDIVNKLTEATTSTAEAVNSDDPTLTITDTASATAGTVDNEINGLVRLTVSSDGSITGTVWGNAKDGTAVDGTEFTTSNDALLAGADITVGTFTMGTVSIGEALSSGDHYYKVTATGKGEDGETTAQTAANTDVKVTATVNLGGQNYTTTYILDQSALAGTANDGEELQLVANAVTYNADKDSYTGMNAVETEPETATVTLTLAGYDNTVASYSSATMDTSMEGLVDDATITGYPDPNVAGTTLTVAAAKATAGNATVNQTVTNTADGVNAFDVSGALAAGDLSISIETTASSGITSLSGTFTGVDKTGHVYEDVAVKFHSDANLTTEVDPSTTAIAGTTTYAAVSNGTSNVLLGTITTNAANTFSGTSEAVENAWTISKPVLTTDDTVFTITTTPPSATATEKHAYLTTASITGTNVDLITTDDGTTTGSIDFDKKVTLTLNSALTDPTGINDNTVATFVANAGVSDNVNLATLTAVEGDADTDTIGTIAKYDTKLRDLEQFWDSQGNFLLEDPQTITITQGDGKTAKVTLYQYDTVKDMTDKINSAIADDLGQSAYTTGKGLKSFATFVSNEDSTSYEGTPDTSEAVEGTMLIRSIVPGKTGTLRFASNNEDLINALGINTIQSADASTYTVTIQDAHTGDVVNGIENEKITGNVLVGRLHQNVDVEFDAMSGITATWDDTAKAFTYTSASETTYLHLADNTTVFQIGANEGDDMGINIGDMRSHALGLDGVLVTDHESASRSIGIIDSAIDKVSTQRAKLGAYQNRLEHTATNLTTSAENLTAAESRIRDTDMAKEMMNFTKLQIMLQAGNSMLAQANQLPQNVLSLIR